MVKPYAGSDFEPYRALSKKDHEIALVTGALQRLGLAGFNVIPSERPDALVAFDVLGDIVIGCEVQTLQADDSGTGSELREFHTRWIQIMERVISTLRDDRTPTPYCTVWFAAPSYGCLHDVRNDDLVAELVVVGRQLRAAAVVTFPRADTPTLNRLLSEIRVVEADGEGLLWWPAHLKSGVVSQLDAAVTAAVSSKNALAAFFDWRGAEERLLLLVAEGRGLTDVIGRARPFELSAFSSHFTWIVIWDKSSEDVWSIFPRYSVICDGGRRVRRPELLPQTLRRFSNGNSVYPTRPKRR